MILSSLCCDPMSIYSVFVRFSVNLLLISHFWICVVCRACDIAKYCSNVCQRNDKFRHEAECKPVAIVRSCSSCKKSGSGLRACTGCYRVYYCDIKCQKSHRKVHKSDCSRTEDTIIELAQKMLLFFTRPKLHVPDHYYWGNHPAYMMA